MNSLVATSFRIAMSLLLVGMVSCSPPILKKIQMRAAKTPSFQSVLNSPEPVVLAYGGFSDWQRLWVEEAEKPAQIQYLPKDSALDIVAPKGLTLWYKDPFKGNVTFRFLFRAVSGPDSLDRCSDLNCFWMATDLMHPDSIFARKDFRGGVFGKSYSLVLYYMGFGGNSNTTTRFREYDGDYDGFIKGLHRPPILKEYADSEHLIKPDHWYSVVISVRDGLVEYWSDNELLVHYQDITPLTKGWFGFRTTQNHLQIRNFTAVKP